MLLVVLTHAGVGFLPGGFVGVDVFFVVSGFLITGLLLKEARDRGSVSLLDFYVRRARRILPAAALTLVVTDVAAYYVLNFVRAEDAVADSLHAAAFRANFRFADRGVDYFAQSDPPSPILHYWSLSVEEQFYFVWPLLLSLALFGLARRRRRRPAGRHRERWLLRLVLVLASASLAWSVYLTGTLPTQAYFSPFTRAWELGLGAILAVAASTLARAPDVARVLMGWAGLAAIALAALAFSDTTPFPGWAALVPTIGTAMAIVAGMGDRAPRFAVAPLLAVRPMTIIGDRSYALYLWHWPVLILATQYAGEELPLETKLALLVGAFLLSCVSYALVENPIRRKVRGRAATGGVVAICTAAILVTAATSLGAIDRKQQRFEAAATNSTATSADIWQTRVVRGAVPAVVAAVQAARSGRPLPPGLQPRIGELRTMPRRYAPANECISHDSSSRVASKVCRIGRSSSRKLVILVGDSHAMMWLPPVVEMARRDGLAVVPLLRLGCTPGKWADEGSPACGEWFRWATQQVERLRPQVTLLAGSIPERESPSLRAATTGILAAARALQPLSRVIVIGDPEGLNDDPVDCLLSSRASMASCTTTWPAASLVGYDRIARGATQLGVGFLPTRGFVCFERRCPAVIGNTIAWMDNNHLTAAYSAQLAGVFRAAFLEAVPAGLSRRADGRPARDTRSDVRSAR